MMGRGYQVDNVEGENDDLGRDGGRKSGGIQTSDSVQERSRMKRGERAEVEGGAG